MINNFICIDYLFESFIIINWNNLDALLSGGLFFFYQTECGHTISGFNVVWDAINQQCDTDRVRKNKNPIFRVLLIKLSPVDKTVGMGNNSIRNICKSLFITSKWKFGLYFIIIEREFPLLPLRWKIVCSAAFLVFGAIFFTLLQWLIML